MKNRPILISAVVISIAMEVILILLVYDKIGSERLPSQITRLVFQIIFILLLFSPKFNWGLFLLTAYHIISGLFVLFQSLEAVDQFLGFYHVVIGIVIYFHDWLEEKFIYNNIEASNNKN